MEINKKLLDEMIGQSGGNLLGATGLIQQLTKALLERMLEAN